MENRFDIRIKHDNEEEYFVIDGTEKKSDAQELVNLLINGIRTGTIKSGSKKENAAFTKYIFNVEYFDEKEEEHQKNKMVIKVANYDKDGLRCINSIEELCQHSVRMKYENSVRVAAGILLGVLLLTVSGPTIAKGLTEVLRREDEFNRAKVNTSISQSIGVDHQQELRDAYQRYETEEGTYVQEQQFLKPQGYTSSGKTK